MRSFELAREEASRLFRKPIMVLAVVVMVAIPLLYGALYLWAFWDPYGALDRIPIALVNLDRPARAGDGPMTAGSDLTRKLLDERTFDWRVVNAEEAARGVREGRYYASLTIPEDFSSTLAKADSDSPRPARLIVVLHESKNMIAGQIAGKVFSEVRKAASTSASRTYFDSVLLGFDEIRDGLDDAADGSRDLADGLGRAVDGSQSLATGAADAREGGERLAEGLGRLAAGASSVAKGTHAAAHGTRSLATGAATLCDATAALSDGASRLSTGAVALARGLGELESGTTSLSLFAASLADGTSRIDSGVTLFESGLESAAAGAEKLNAGAADVSRSLAALAVKYPDVASDPLFRRATANAAAVASGTTGLSDSLSDSQESLSSLCAAAHQVASGSQLLAVGVARITSATAQAHSGATELADGARALESGAQKVNAGATRLAAGAERGATGFARLSSGSATLAEKVRRVDEGANSLAGGLQRLGHGTMSLAENLDTAKDGARRLSEGLSAGVADVPRYTKAGRAARAEMMSDPVALEETKLGAVETYGTGFAPYFIPLALWVGMLIVYVLLAPVPENAARSGASPPVVVMTGLWPAIIIGLGQSTLLYAVLRFSLGLTPVRPWATLGIIVLTSVVYAAIMQWLNTAFGPVGKLLGIVALMLQLTSAAGTFPLETLPAFFRTVSPFMPMTHVVAALRESVSGGDVAAMAREAWTTALFGAAAVAATILSARDVSSWPAERLKPTIEL